MYEKSRDPRKRVSKVGLDVRKAEGSSKTCIQSGVGYTKSRRILENADPKWSWMHEKPIDPRKRVSKVGLDARKVERSSKTCIQSGVGCTKSRRILKNVDPYWSWMYEKSRDPRKRRSRIYYDAGKESPAFLGDID